ncbi:primosomal protein N' [Paenibacillus cymbidii]|uniref:primosomal protein N' n=1 Tax=Paenibacillus cymbidii TaxID=1639034 RepID=UPI0010805FD7|nr:primosomal protein N' [Paenibacillus cymbidii]
MTIAKVIVDVPARQTNRAFDYIVPADCVGWVDVGSRVAVPFGPRLLQGFVVALEEEAGVKASKLKPLDQVLDAEPPLTRELVALAGWMSRRYLCHEVTALQAMIPAALKAKYERLLTLGAAAEEPAAAWTGGASREPAEEAAFGQAELFAAEELFGDDDIVAFVRERGSVTLEAVQHRFPGCGAAIRRLIRAGWLAESQTVKDRMAAKKVLTVFPPERPESLDAALELIPARAKRQRDVVRYLREHPAPIRLTELMLALEVGAGTVKELADKGFIALREVTAFRDPYANRTFARTEPLPLTAEQQRVFGAIGATLAAGEHRVFLLKGVTGSGKTEVYLQAIQRCFDKGKEAIVLVPEISLTPQMVERFKSRFGSDVAVLHSKLSNGERYDEWRKIAQGRVKMAIGARSAIFAPFARLGLIIIDEEHEASYKQEDSPKYDARDVAIERARAAGAAVVLGSATPSLESFERTLPNGRDALSGAYELLEMRERVAGRPMPPVRIVDMREELKGGNRAMFSRPLYKALQERLQRGEQSVLLLNRRGYSTFVMCRTCGHTLGCPHCAISLTYHQNAGAMRCHYCGYAERQPKTCPSCESEHIRYFGTGTQRVEEELGKLFPGIRVIRMDVDTTSEKGAHEKWLTLFGDGKADVLLGTQMVAKGLDFPNVTLVGVIAADTVLHLPDFRAAERTFQLMTQVAGRAGRHRLPGEVFVQTYTPEHYSIVTAADHDYGAFAGVELDSRRQLGYPPFSRLILLTLSHENPQLLVKSAESLAGRLKELAASAAVEPGFACDILGPVASPISRIKDRYRFQCVVKYRGTVRMSELVREAVASLDDVCRQEGLQISVDVDPQMMM